jgi:acetyl-CoA acetyltransferase
VEAACSSSAVALHLAMAAIRAGQLETALVIGVEQLSVFGRGTLRLNADDPEIAQGLTMPAAYAMRAQRYMAATGAVVEDLAAVSVKNHANGALNPDAQFRRPTPLDEVLGSRPVADPLTLLQCCGSGDGAAAVAQVVEVTRHLAGRTGTLAHRPGTGLTHCTGGGISGYDHAVCTIHVLIAT